MIEPPQRLNLQTLITTDLTVLFFAPPRLPIYHQSHVQGCDRLHSVNKSTDKKPALIRSIFSSQVLIHKKTVIEFPLQQINAFTKKYPNVPFRDFIVKNHKNCVIFPQNPNAEYITIITTGKQTPKKLKTNF